MNRLIVGDRMFKKIKLNSINNFISIINFDYANTLYEKIKEI